MKDLTKALVTLAVAVVGCALILLYALSNKAHAFTASEVEAQHCGVEGGCVLISQQRLKREIERYAEEAYENGIKVGMNECRQHI